MQKNQSKSAKSAALNYAANILADAGSHVDAFSNNGLSVEEQRIAQEYLSSIAERLQQEAQEIENFQF